MMEENEARILLVDDDADAVTSLTRALRAAGFSGKISGAGTSERALEMLAAQDPCVAVVDLSLNPREGVQSGFKLLRSLVASSKICRVIVLTGHASVEHGIEALNLGAAHFLEKPASVPHLLSLLRDSIRQSDLRRTFEELKSSASGIRLEELIIGKSAAASALREAVLYAASNSQAVFLGGETGTGKGLCAQAIHRFGMRSKGKLVRYQPNFSNPDIVNSDLFGHLKGAFTGAGEARQGLIAEAHMGSLFLDELDELPAETQVTLLGVLQDRRFRSLGGNEEQEVDFRLISASNRNLEESAAKGKLRADFLHRAAHLRIEVPALRNRKEDIRALADFTISGLRAREQLNVFELSPPAERVLMDYEWPGNVRELQAVISGAAYRASYERRSVIEESDVRVGQVFESKAAACFSEQVERFKLKLIDDALRRNGGNQVKAAEELKLDRSTMRRILARTR